MTAAPLADLRRAAGLTQRDAAALVGWSQPKLHRAETGGRVTSDAEVTRLQELYAQEAARPRPPDNLADALWQWRRGNGLTQQQLADRCTQAGAPVADATIAALEQGRERPRRALGQVLAELMTGGAS